MPEASTTTVAATTAAAHLRTERLTRSFGRLIAVSAVDFEAAPGELRRSSDPAEHVLQADLGGARVDWRARFLDGEDVTGLMFFPEGLVGLAGRGAPRPAR